MDRQLSLTACLQSVCAHYFLRFFLLRTVFDQARPWQAHETSLDSHGEEEGAEEKEDDDEFAADNDHDDEMMVVILMILVIFF